MKVTKKRATLGFVVLLLIAAFPFYYDTGDAYDLILKEYGSAVGLRIRAAAPECTDDGVGTIGVPFGVLVSYCGTRWLVLFNRIPFHVSGGEIPSGLPSDVPLGGSVLDTRYWSKTFDFNIAYPSTVYPLSEEADHLAFSLLPPDDPRQQSSTGLVSALTFTHANSAPKDATPMTIDIYDNPNGIRALKSESIGAYGGETHRTYFFRDYGIAASYVVTPQTEAAFEPMIRSILFNSVPKVTLTDGEDAGLGVFDDAESVNGLKSFQSSELDISLTYPARYLLFTRDGFIAIMPEEPVLATVARIRAGAGGGEWPPGIMIAFFPQQDESISLEEWIRSDSRANFAFPLPPGESRENTLTPITVAGMPAFAYRNDGLYAYDYIVFKYRTWIVLASSSSVDGTSNSDFRSILDSIRPI